MRLKVLALLVTVLSLPVTRGAYASDGPGVILKKLPATIPPDKIVIVEKDGTIRMMDCPVAPDPATFKIEPLQVPAPPPQGVNVTPGKPIKRVSPQFPACAEERGLSGVVDFAFTVEPDGSVGDIKLLQEVPAGFGFADAAKAVLPQWQYQPRLVDGKPVAYAVTFRFSMRHVDQP